MPQYRIIADRKYEVWQREEMTVTADNIEEAKTKINKECDEHLSINVLYETAEPVNEFEPIEIYDREDELIWEETPFEKL